MNRGRKRKGGAREPNGRPQRPSLRDLEQGETATVLRQPHRAGDADPLLECPLGRFVRRRRLRNELFLAGLQYGQEVRHLFAIKGIPLPVSDGFAGSGKPMSAKAARRLTERIAKLDRAMIRASPVGFEVVRALAVFEVPCQPHEETFAVKALLELAVLELDLPRSAHPFVGD